MKIALTKKENIVRIFTSERLSPLFAFWLGKCLRDLETSHGYRFLLTEESWPETERTFWGIKILDIERESEETAVEELLHYIQDLIEHERRRG